MTIYSQETILIANDKIEIDVELSIDIVDESFDYEYGSIRGTEERSGIELNLWEIVSAHTNDNAKLELAIEPWITELVEQAVQEINLEKIVDYEIEKRENI